MTLQEIKHKFFAYRNGVVADVLRRSGMPYKMIFGVDIPTITSISKKIGYDASLAEQLWADKEIRESRLLAIYLFDPAAISRQRVLDLCNDVQTREEADILQFRLLRHLPYEVDKPFI